MQLLCKCLNNNAVNTLWNTPYYICTNIRKSIKIVCVCVWGGGGKAQKFILQLMSIVYYNYNFVQTLVLFQTKSSEIGHNFTVLIDPFS